MVCMCFQLSTTQTVSHRPVDNVINVNCGVTAVHSDEVKFILYFHELQLILPQVVTSLKSNSIPSVSHYRTHAAAATEPI